MTDLKDLRLAKPEDVAQAIEFSLQFSGRKRMHDASGMMARIVAERLVEHLEMSGFVVLRKPPAKPLGWSATSPSDPPKADG